MLIFNKFLVGLVILPSQLFAMCPEKTIGDVVTGYDGWCSYYSTEKKIPLLVEYTLTSEMIKCSNVARPTNFINDPSIPKSMQSSDRVYAESGYDKGHMASNDNFNFSVESAKRTFYFTNIVPQSPNLNRKHWLTVERLERLSALTLSNVKVQNYSIGTDGKSLKDGTKIPSGFLKVLYHQLGKQCYYFSNEYPEQGGEVNCNYFEKVIYE